MSSSAVAYAQENHPRFLNELKAFCAFPLFPRIRSCR